jgi:anti-sigma28 factor (negative regulator of flagellin synthesis)
VVEISKAAQKLGSQAVNRADLEAASEVRQARVEQVRQRVASGFYDRPEVRQAIAEAVLDSGVVDGVEREARFARTAQDKIADVPDVREDRVAQARQRVASGFYNSTGVMADSADSILDALIG